MADDRDGIFGHGDHLYGAAGLVRSGPGFDGPVPDEWCRLFSSYLRFHAGLHNHERCLRTID